MVPRQVAASDFEDVPSDALAWLLEPSNPSVRYLALRDLLDRPESDAETAAARAAIMTTGPVPKILAKQRRGGYWGVAEDFYIRSLYKGTVWTFILLADLCADGRDPRIRAACEFLFHWSQDRTNGGFAYRGSKKSGGQPSGVVPCLTGNIAWALERFGLGEDPRTLKAVDWLVRYQRLDDGEGPAPKGKPYDGREPCYGRHTCFMGAAKAVKALAEIPAGRRTPEVRRFLDDAAEYFLKHRIFKRSHDLSRPGKLFWTRLCFPTMWRFDPLEMLDLLAGLGVRDKRLKDAVDLVKLKRDASGRWRLENSFEGRTIVPLERMRRPSKWLTLFALRTLRRLDD